MVVELDIPSCRDQCILKLYDRRFAEQLRRDEDAAPWDTQIEDQYYKYAHSGLALKSFELWSAKSDEDEYWEDEQRGEWDHAQVEAYLQFLCLRTYRMEKHAYDLLSDIQGKHIPRLLGEVILETSTEPNSDSDSLSGSLDCPGILLQYIRGFPLTDLADNIPRTSWQYVCDEAIKKVHRIGDRGVCNRDINSRSFVVKGGTDTATSQVYMLDFGLCAFRSRAKDEREFRAWQADQDEEGAVGYVMEGKLNGVYKYHKSDRSERLLDEFKSEAR